MKKVEKISLLAEVLAIDIRSSCFDLLETDANRGLLDEAPPKAFFWLLLAWLQYFEWGIGS